MNGFVLQMYNKMFREQRIAAVFYELLNVHGSALRAVPFLLQFRATVTTTVVAAWLQAVPSQGPDDVDYEQGIADVVDGEDAEDDVDDGAGGYESQQVEDGLAEGQAASHVVEGCNADEDDGPQRAEEDGEPEGHGVGVQGGVVVEVSPHLGVEELYAAVEGGRGGHEQAEQGGVERGMSLRCTMRALRRMRRRST